MKHCRSSRTCKKCESFALAKNTKQQKGGKKQLQKKQISEWFDDDYVVTVCWRSWTDAVHSH